VPAAFSALAEKQPYVGCGRFFPGLGLSALKNWYSNFLFFSVNELNEMVWEKIEKGNFIPARENHQVL
jgi:hypothetical protein